MSQRAEELARRVRDFNNEVIAVVEKCSEEDWNKICEWEQWSVGVTARHIGAGHYSAVELAKMIVNKDPLPPIAEKDVIQMANDHAEKHSNCAQKEVLDILRNNGNGFADYVAGLDDDDLDRTGNMELTGGDVTTQQLIEFVAFHSGAEHLENIKKTLG